MGNTLLIEKAVLTRKEAWEYCGGRPFFERLEERYPELLTPIVQRKMPKAGMKPRASFLRSVIDTALKQAHLDRAFIES